MNTNRNFVLNIMSIAVMIYGIAMIPSLVVAYRYNEVSVYSVMSVIVVICGIVGIMGYRFLGRDLANVKFKYCYMTTIFTWLLLIALSTLPYYLSGMSYSYIDCLFESTASWTTTGASAIRNSALPIGLKLWRSTCNWMGGIGIILLSLAFLPKMQYIGQKLASTEIRGPGFLMSTITFRKAYRSIIAIYAGFTIAQYILLRFVGMGQLDSLLTALSNTSTSGLQHISNGVITGLSTSVKAVISVFAFLSSVNISTFIAVLAGKGKRLLHSSELKIYLLIIASGTALITLSLCIQNRGSNIASTFGNTLMQIVSFSSTAGYIVTPCYKWNTFCLAIITAITFMGACAISTGGGLKISRMVYAFKTLSNNVYSRIHPSSVRIIKYNGQVAEPEYIRRTKLYIAIFFITYILGAMLLTIDGTDVYSALSYSHAMLTNLGSPLTELADPGLMSHASDFSKGIMSLLMLCGRLEIYPVLMLFSYSFWSAERKGRNRKNRNDMK